MTALRQRMLEDMKIRNLALNTQTSYLLQVSQFARHFGKSPEVLGSEDIRAYQLYLTQEKKLSPKSITIAVSALRFLYKVTLRREWKLEDIIPAPKAAYTNKGISPADYVAKASALNLHLPVVSVAAGIDRKP